MQTPLHGETLKMSVARQRRRELSHHCMPAAMTATRSACSTSSCCTPSPNRVSASREPRNTPILATAIEEIRFKAGPIAERGCDAKARGTGPPGPAMPAYKVFGGAGVTASWQALRCGSATGIRWHTPANWPSKAVAAGWSPSRFQAESFATSRSTDLRLRS